MSDRLADAIRRRDEARAEREVAEQRPTRGGPLWSRLNDHVRSNNDLARSHRDLVDAHRRLVRSHREALAASIRLGRYVEQLEERVAALEELLDVHPWRAPLLGPFVPFRPSRPATDDVERTA